MKKKLSVSIGIPTHEAGESLVVLLNSLYGQTCYKSIDKILVIVDGNRISDKICQKIQNKKLIIKIFKNRAGQSARINDIFKNLNSDYTILTNDDVCLEKDSIKNLLKNAKYDLVAGCTKPYKSNSYFESIVCIGAKINHLIASKWDKGDNYLACNGRLLMISSRLKLFIKIPKKLWNNDAYIFLTCNRNNFSFKHIEKSVCYYQSPQNLREHLKQSIKFQNSQYENTYYLQGDLSKFYSIPLKDELISIARVFMDSPFNTMIYILLAVYTRSVSPRKKIAINTLGYWCTDKSTKLAKSF